MRDIAIGAVARDGVLTHVIREGATLLTPTVVAVDDPLDAAASLLELRARRYRYDNPLFYVDASGAGSAVVDVIREVAADVALVPVAMQGDAASTVAGVAFHDRVSELMFRLRELVEARAVCVPNVIELYEELDAFTELPGKAVRFASPLEVERNLGRYPALAVAALLATIGLERPAIRPPRDYTLAPEHPDRATWHVGHNPYESIP